MEYFSILYQVLHNPYSILGSKKYLKGGKYEVMYYTLCRSYRGPDRPIKKKEASTPTKASMIEYNGGELILYHHHQK